MIIETTPLEGLKIRTNSNLVNKKLPIIYECHLKLLELFISQPKKSFHSHKKAVKNLEIFTAMLMKKPFSCCKILHNYYLHFLNMT